MPTIDIVIPAHNASKTLRRCLKSIQAQTFRDYAITVVDDGSTDATPGVLKEFTPEVRIISQPNRGAAVARNAGAALGTAPFLIFIDADSTLLPQMLEKLHRLLERTPTASYAYCSFRFGHKTFRLWEFDSERLRRMPYIHTTSLLRRRDFSGFDGQLRRFQDWDLWLTLLEQKKIGVWLPEILFSVRTGGTMSHWLPSFAYRWPFLSWLPQVEAYRNAKDVIAKKHGL